MKSKQSSQSAVGRITSSIAVLFCVTTLSLKQADAAVGGEHSGGGNGVVAHHFVDEAVVLYKLFTRIQPQLPSWFNLQSFENAIKNTRVYEAQEIDSSTEARGVYLHAQFDRDAMTIKIREGAVAALRREELRSLILHEYLGILNLERGGQYYYSSQLYRLVLEFGTGKYAPDIQEEIDCRGNPYGDLYWTLYLEKLHKYHLHAGSSAPVRDQIAFALVTQNVPALLELNKQGLFHANEPLASGFGTSWDLETNEIQIKWFDNSKPESALGVTTHESPSPALIQFLLSQGADPNGLENSSTGRLSASPLKRVLSRESSDPDVIQLLISAGATYTNSDGLFDPDLTIAATPIDQFYPPDTVCAEKLKWQMILALGADINEKSALHYPVTPAMILADNNSLIMLRLFRELGAQFNLQTVSAAPELGVTKGMTALHLLAKAYRTQKVATARYLVEQGANPSLRDANRKTPLDTAVEELGAMGCSGLKQPLTQSQCAHQQALIEYLKSVTPVAGKP